MTASCAPLVRLMLAISLALSTLMLAETAHARKHGNGAGFRVVIKPFLFHRHHSGNMKAQETGEPCPKDFNCGHRVYADQTGPRIIQVGSRDKGELDYNGPRIIRLKD